MGDEKTQKAKYLGASEMNKGTIEHAACVKNLTVLQEEEEKGNTKDLPFRYQPRG